MKRYSVEVSSSAERQLGKIQRRDQVRIARAMSGLASDPRPAGSRKLAGYDDVYRIRVGTYRVIYSVDEGKIIVIVLKIGHRRDVYR